MTKKEAIGLTMRKTFSNKEIFEDFYVKKFDYMIDFYLPKRNLAIKIELGYFDRDLVTKNKRQKQWEDNIGCTFLGIKPDKKDFSAYDALAKVQIFLDESKDV